MREFGLRQFEGMQAPRDETLDVAKFHKDGIRELFKKHAEYIDTTHISSGTQEDIFLRNTTETQDIHIRINRITDEDFNRNEALVVQFVDPEQDISPTYVYSKDADAVVRRKDIYASPDSPFLMTGAVPGIESNLVQGLLDKTVKVRDSGEELGIIKPTTKEEISYVLGLAERADVPSSTFADLKQTFKERVGEHGVAPTAEESLHAAEEFGRYVDTFLDRHSENAVRGIDGGRVFHDSREENGLEVSIFVARQMTEGEIYPLITTKVTQNTEQTEQSTQFVYRGSENELSAEMHQRIEKKDEIKKDIDYTTRASVDVSVAREVRNFLKDPQVQ